MKWFLPIVLCFSFLGCNVQEYDKPPATPDAPVVKSVAGAFARALANRNDKHLIADRREMAALIQLCRRAGDLTDDDIAKFESKFHGMNNDNKSMTPEDSATLRTIE